MPNPSTGRFCVRLIRSKMMQEADRSRRAPVASHTPKPTSCAETRAISCGERATEVQIAVNHCSRNSSGDLNLLKSLPRTKIRLFGNFAILFVTPLLRQRRATLQSACSGAGANCCNLSSKVTDFLTHGQMKQCALHTAMCFPLLSLPSSPHPPSFSLAMALSLRQSGPLIYDDQGPGLPHGYVGTNWFSGTILESSTVYYNNTYTETASLGDSFWFIFNGA